MQIYFQNTLLGTKCFTEPLMGHVTYQQTKLTMWFLGSDYRVLELCNFQKTKPLRLFLVAGSGNYQYVPSLFKYS